MVPEHYADLYRQFSGYMRNWGGTKLFLIACGPNGNDVNWSRKFLTQNSGGRIPDGFSMHFYEKSQLTPTKFTVDAMNTQMSTFQRVELAIFQQRALLDGFEPRPAALDESHARRMGAYGTACQFPTRKKLRPPLAAADPPCADSGP